MPVHLDVSSDCLRCLLLVAGDFETNDGMKIECYTILICRLIIQKTDSKSHLFLRMFSLQVKHVCVLMGLPHCVVLEVLLGRSTLTSLLKG